MELLIPAGTGLFSDVCPPVDGQHLVSRVLSCEKKVVTQGSSRFLGNTNVVEGGLSLKYSFCLAPN